MALLTLTSFAAAIVTAPVSPPIAVSTLTDPLVDRKATVPVVEVMPVAKVWPD